MNNIKDLLRVAYEDSGIERVDLSSTKNTMSFQSFIITEFKNVPNIEGIVYLIYNEIEDLMSLSSILIRRENTNVNDIVRLSLPVSTPSSIDDVNDIVTKMDELNVLSIDDIPNEIKPEFDKAKLLNTNISNDLLNRLFDSKGI